MFSLVRENQNDDGRIRITLSGEIDIACAPEFKRKLNELVGNGENDIELLCGGLTYIDSTGLGILVGALKKVKDHQNNIYIYQLRDNIRKLFRITGLDSVFILEDVL